MVLKVINDILANFAGFIYFISMNIIEVTYYEELIKIFVYSLVNNITLCYICICSIISALSVIKYFKSK